VIITRTEPYVKDEIDKSKECFDVYIKTVMDIKKRICCAGMDRNFEGEKILLSQGSSQSDIWGGGIDLETKEIDYNSFINIRPSENLSNEIQDPAIRKKYEELTQYFFAEIL